MSVRVFLFIVAFVFTLVGCGWLFDQKPVCPSRHPNCWMEDPAFVHAAGVGLDAGADGDAR
ncbi:MAG: hypothetical protein NVS3B7_16770 [Candidatus Elarobacter sp.]